MNLQFILEIFPTALFRKILLLNAQLKLEKFPYALLPKSFLLYVQSRLENFTAAQITIAINTKLRITIPYE